MLQHVRVRNIALMDEVDIDLDEGLNVITGETGAGKSILLGAINLALGARSGKDIVRDKQKGAGVDLLFSGVSQEILKKLEEDGTECSGDEVLISRRFTASGRSTSSINGQLVTTQQVRDCAQALIDIHGQHEHQSLLSQQKHIELLDRFVENSEEKLDLLKEAFQSAKETLKELDKYREDARDRARILSLMEYEIREIEEANWKEGEEEALKEEKQRLMYAEKLQNAAMEAHTLLDGSSRNSASCLEMISDALSKIHQAARYDEEFFSPYANQMEELLSILQDISGEMRDYAENMENDPERLDAIEDRLSLIGKLKDKYGKDVESCMAYLEKRKEEHDKLLHIEETMEKLQKEYDRQRKHLAERAAEMTGLRRKAAGRIADSITKVLATLEFEEPVFEVKIEEKEISARGQDQVTFMIRTNVGEELMPLHKIASGGEMSRVMLAIKTILAQEDEIGTMIFDEIDTGISGRTAQSVAEKMSQIAVYHQVICVSHLPQIAAMADNHLRIEKVVRGEKTYTEIQKLEGEEVTLELSRMLGGSMITEAVRENAREMKKLADKVKESQKG